MPGESLAENIAKASDGTRDTYGELIESINRDPLNFQTLSERTKLSLLSSPKFHDMVFKELNPNVVEIITTDDIYQQLKAHGHYDKFTDEVRREWEEMAKARDFETTFIQHYYHKKKIKK